MDFEIRTDRKPQGPRKLARERAAYLQLVSEGHSYSAACRIVGVNAKTGRRWRNGRNPVGNHQGAPPLTSILQWRLGPEGQSVLSRFVP
jgi:transposase-like protein